ncbi:MAG: RDD family protein [Dehalococcoidia bacterium]
MRSATNSRSIRAVGQFGDYVVASVFCTECGAQLPSGARYCIRCGTPATGSDTITLETRTYTLAGFGRRLAGRVIDMTLLEGPLVAAVFVAAVVSLQSDCVASRGECLRDDLDGLRAPVILVLLQLIPLVYWSLWDSFGTSPGRWLVGVRLVTRSGSPPGLRRGCVRALVSQLASARVLYLGYLWALWDRERRTWHDHAAKTWAVRR